MQPEAGSPAAWMRFARSDLAIARGGPDPEILLEGLCFHAQQAAEKAIKAVLIQFGIPAPRTHSIEHLVGLLPASIERVPVLTQAAGLTQYAVEFRYPSDEESVTDEEHAEAVHIAERVICWAEELIKS
jgi:HEPN domain-containing protein